MRKPIRVLCAALSVLAAAGCGGTPLPAQSGYGAEPQIPEPRKGFFPTVKIAPAKGWPPGEAPDPAPGLKVTLFAKDLDHPRWLLALPNGDVLVAESNKPAKKPDGVRGWIMAKVQSMAGAGVPSADRITLLRDADGDGVAEMRTVFLKDLYSPFGMALVGGDLYVANADALVRFPYREGQTEITEPPAPVTALPGGPINHHWTKNVIASPDGSKLYVSVGSNSNVGENGMAAEVRRAAILEVDRATGAVRVFASGLRNPNGMAWEPTTGALWTVVNERDEIGDDLVPDYLTSVRDGGFYGWPYSYWGQTVDERVSPPRPDLVARAIRPDYGLGAHTASLGLTFGQDATALPPRWRSGAHIGQHGSWNRSQFSGYKVVFVPFSAGRPSGPPQDLLTGFLSPDGNAWGRPVGVIVDRRGGLLVADDVGNAIWRVSGG